MKYPRTLQNLIECFQKLPGIGEKTAERLALATLKFDQNVIDVFAASLKDTKKKIKKCSRCNNLAEEELCEICMDKKREKDTLCVVEDPKNIILFEKLDTFKGYYHVIDGLISPLEGINPEDVHIPELISRIKKEKIKEVILAVKPSIEGETTSLYISKMLSGTDVLVSKIAHGVPLGAEIDYVDALTLELALTNRKKIANDD